MQSNTLDVSRWQLAPRQFNYSPPLQFFARIINVALIDCNCELARMTLTRGVLQAVTIPGADPKARPTDEALLARDWIARSGESEDPRAMRYLTFPRCCELLGADADHSREALLAVVDTAADFDTDDCWERLETLAAAELQDDEEPLFWDAPRCVPAVDQLLMFAGAE